MENDANNYPAGTVCRATGGTLLMVVHKSSDAIDDKTWVVLRGPVTKSPYLFEKDVWIGGEFVTLGILGGLDG